MFTHATPVCRPTAQRQGQSRLLRGSERSLETLWFGGGRAGLAQPWLPGARPGRATPHGPSVFPSLTTGLAAADRTTSACHSLDGRVSEHP